MRLKKNPCLSFAYFVTTAFVSFDSCRGDPLAFGSVVRRRRPFSAWFHPSCRAACDGCLAIKAVLTTP